MSVGKWLLAILFAATTAASGFAQGELGRVSGIVRDQSNAFVAAATQIREFDIVTRNADGTIASINRPFAEIDYKTSGGHDSYNSMQLSLTRRSARGVAMNAQYTLGYSQGNTGGSNEAATVGNNARAIGDFDYDDGYNNFDIRHTFNLSLLYTIPGNGALTGGWSIGGIANARSGLPIPVLITRNDIVYVDAAGIVWNNATADRTAIINTPGGGASRATRRPDLIPGVSPYIEDGGRIYLNPAAFATPKPGTFGNLEQLNQGTRLPADRSGRCEADRLRPRTERRTTPRSLQRLRPRQLRQPASHPAQRAARRRRESDAGQPRATRTALHRGVSRDVRRAESNGGDNGWPRHEPQVQLAFRFTF